MDEQVGLVGRDPDRVGGRGVAGDDDLAPGAGRAHDLLGDDAVDGLAALQAAEVGARGHAQALRPDRVERARALVLDQRVAEGPRGAVLDAEGSDDVAVAAHRLAGLELDQLHVVGQLADDRAQHAHEVAQAGRPVDGQRAVAVAQGEGLEQAGDAQPVVQMEVREEQRVEVGEAHRGNELALRALPAVEQDALSPTPNEQRRHPAPTRRHGPRRTGEKHLQIHTGERSTVAP